MKINEREIRKRELDKLNSEELHTILNGNANFEDKLLIAEILSGRENDGSGTPPDDDSLDDREQEK